MSMRNPKPRRKRLRDEHAEATRAAVVAAARTLFGTRGYGDTSIDDVAVAARATKGAVYHHFRDKRAVFRAVYDDMARELVAEIVRQTPDPNPREALRSFLAYGKTATVRRIMFRDGPLVLGGECREIDAKYALGMLTAMVRATADRDLRDESEIVARLLLALAIEAAQIIGAANAPRRATRAIEAVMSRILEALRSNAT